MPNPPGKMSADVVSYDSPPRDDFESPFHEFSSHPPAGSLVSNTEQLLICTACGTQFDVENPALLNRCRICDDPRQYVPATGQAFTTMAALKAPGKYSNMWRQFDGDERFWSIWTEPKFAIGQRCILIRTPLGNVLWDCITLLDHETIARVNAMGGLAAIVISHPHYYTSHLEWAQAFSCPVYMSREDLGWLNRLDRLGKARAFIEGSEEEIEVHGEKTGVKVLKLGGHFPGSLVCVAFGRLLIADTMLTTPSGLGDWSIGADGGLGGRPDGMNSYSFMWSIPNMIPLAPEDISKMWALLGPHEFESTHGAFVGTEIRNGGGGSQASVKERILQSMQIQVWRTGWKDHALLKESC